jgi:excisionase family DNA binding protein
MEQRTPTLPPDRDAFTTTELAKRWGISLRSVERAIARGEIRAIKIGRCVRISSKEVRRLLAGPTH